MSTIFINKKKYCYCHLPFGTSRYK